MSGSLWITAYDELGKKIFHDMGGNAVKQLNSLNKEELLETVENYHYQALKMKIVTKKDSEGRVRHNAGYLYELSEDRSAKENLQRIHELMV